MPAALAFASAYAVSNLAAAAGVSVAGQAAAAAFVTTAGAQFVIGTAVTVGASVALSALNRPAMPKPSSGLINIKEPVAPRLIHYGTRKVGGSLAFIGRTGGGAPNLSKVICISAREIDAVEQHYLNGKAQTLSGSNAADDYHEGEDHAWLYFHSGTDTQAADSELIGITFEDATWTTAHQGKGIAYVHMKLKGPDDLTLISKVFPNGAPEYQARIRGAKLYDPTLDSTNGGSGSCRIDDKTTWVWSDEQRLIMLDYLTHPDCYAKGFAAGTAIEDRVLADCRIDWTSWVSQILRGREAVALNAGGTEKRWRCSTTVDLANEEHTAAFTRIRQAGDARLFMTGDGKIGCAGGGWDAPSVTLDANAHLIDAEFSPIDRMASYNVLKFKYTSPPHDYVEQDGDPWRDEAAIAAAGGIVREMEVDLSAVPSHTQARRLAKIMTARDNTPFSGNVRAKLPGLQVVREEAIDLEFAEFDGGSGDIDGAWWVDGEISVDLETMTVGFGLKKAIPESYDWDEETEEGTAPIVPAV